MIERAGHARARLAARRGRRPGRTGRRSVTSPGAEQLPFAAKFWQRMRPTTSLASIARRRSTSGALGAGQALDEDAGAVVAVDAHVVERERPRLHVGRARRRAREERDAVAGLRAAPATLDRGGGLGGDDVGDAAAGEAALRVEVDDAGLGVGALAVDRDARDVGGDREHRSADDGDEIADAVTHVEVRRIGDPAAGGRPRRDLHEIRAGALQREALDDRQRVGAGRARALGVGARADRDDVARRGPRPTASWMRANDAAGQSCPSSSTNNVAADAPGASTSAPRNAASSVALPPLFTVTLQRSPGPAVAGARPTLSSMVQFVKRSYAGRVSRLPGFAACDGSPWLRVSCSPGAAEPSPRRHPRRRRARRPPPRRHPLARRGARSSEPTALPRSRAAARRPAASSTSRPSTRTATATRTSSSPAAIAAPGSARSPCGGSCGRGRCRASATG